jgi:hypothetical protein
MKTWTRVASALLIWRLTFLGANMTDRTNVVAKLLQAILTSSTAFTISPGTGGGSAFTFTPPYFLRLMTAQGSNTSNGTELSATGYTALGNTMGSSAFGAPVNGVSASSNAVNWTAGAAWTAVVAVEIWDSSGTKQRILQGAITSITLANGNTLSFAAGSITADGSAW